MQGAVLHGVDTWTACYALCKVYSISSMVCAIMQLSMRKTMLLRIDSADTVFLRPVTGCMLGDALHSRIHPVSRCRLQYCYIQG